MKSAPGYVGYWHFADIRGIATICPLLDKSGHWLIANELRAPLAAGVAFAGVLNLAIWRLNG
jgi:hypothetical protein